MWPLILEILGIAGTFGSVDSKKREYMDAGMDETLAEAQAWHDTYPEITANFGTEGGGSLLRKGLTGAGKWVGKKISGEIQTINTLSNINDFENDMFVTKPLHIVKPNDTISKIAQDYGVSISDIIRSNDWLVKERRINGNNILIKPNEQIEIPRGMTIRELIEIQNPGRTAYDRAPLNTGRDPFKPYTKQTVHGEIVGGGGGGGGAPVNPNAETPSMAEDRVKRNPPPTHDNPPNVTESQHEQYVKERFKGSSTHGDQLEEIKKVA